MYQWYIVPYIVPTVSTYTMDMNSIFAMKDIFLELNTLNFFLQGYA